MVLGLFYTALGSPHSHNDRLSINDMKYDLCPGSPLCPSADIRKFELRLNSTVHGVLMFVALRLSYSNILRGQCLPLSLGSH